MSAHRVLHDMLRAPFLMDDPGDAGTIQVDRWAAVCPIVTAAAETRILAQPTKAGLLCTLIIDTYVGDLTLTVTGGYNQAADTSITLGTAGDWITFNSVKVGTNYYWRVLAQEGTSLTITDVIVSTAAITNATLGRMQVAQTAVTAAGSAIGNAANLSYGMNIVGAADNGKGVILPVAVANAVVDVISTVNAKSLLIYPQVNSAIAGLGANGALTLGAANTGAASHLQLNSVRLVATNATQWYVGSV